MKRLKFLPILLILALALAGGVQAASVVPHVHGHDFDHSAHPNCPVHQAQNHSIQIIEAATPVLPARAQFFKMVELSSTSFTYQTFFFQESLRAPPASF